jgi:hypothetical protein
VKQKITIIFLFLTVGLFASPIFAQFGGIDYDIRGGELLGFEIDPETTSLTIPIDARSRGELVITLPRGIIDARDNAGDANFGITVSGLNLNFYDQTATETDRTITIPFSRSDFEIVISGTHLYSQETAADASMQSGTQSIEKRIQEELQNEIPENQAKLLIFSDTDWSGALQSSSFEFTEINGSGDSDLIFDCTSSLGREGVFGAKIEKATQNGSLTLVVIQNQQIMAQGTTDGPFGDVLINGSCASAFGADSGEGGGCLIATAAFGSELAPQVQSLREIRDTKMLQTESGTLFMTSFNDIYYSFSPMIADYERENPVFKEMVKVAITPMISSLSILNHVDMNSNAEVLGYGISLILLNGLMYVGIPVGIVIAVRRRQTLTHLS